MPYDVLPPGGSWAVCRKLIRNMMRGESLMSGLMVGSGSNYFEVEADGTAVLRGDAKVWDDQQVNLSAAVLHPTIRPEWVDYKNGKILAFSTGADEALYFETQITHKYAIGEDIDFHLHTVNPAAVTGTFIWELSYCWANIGDTFPTPTVVTKTVTQELQGAQDVHTLIDIVDIVGTGKNISGLLLCRLRRLGSSDTSTDDAHLMAADFHIPCDTMGSRQELVK